MMKLMSWGLYPRVKSKVFFLNDNFKKELDRIDTLIPFGNGRSYGDSALANNMVYCRAHNFFMSFDSTNGILHCQSGVLLSEIIEFAVPKGWFLKITPGTKLITLGGAIASDIHGKNHHVDGCFSECVVEFNIMLPDGSIKLCKKGEDLFKATSGGMGLTGIILDAKIVLKKIHSKNIIQKTIKSHDLKETFKLFEKYSNFPYSVAWIDCLAKKENLGKALLMVGDFANDGDLNYVNKRQLNIPFFFPSFVLNKFTVKIFNWLYYNRIRRPITDAVVDLDSFFYPLDSINNWNRMYGVNGFTQYQFILPKDKSFDGLYEILEAISNSGKGSFLAVLKLYGKQNENFLSFPMEGYSLAIDFKIEKGLFDFLEKLDEIVNKHEGRIYLAKDVSISKENFEKGYPGVNKFRNYRKSNAMDIKFNSIQSNRLSI